MINKPHRDATEEKNVSRFARIPHISASIYKFTVECN